MSELKILFETENYLAVEKPAGLLVYAPSEGVAEREETVATILASKLDFDDVGERNGIVHRIDRDTSGILLVAKNEDSQEKLKKLFKDRTITKKYLTLVTGALEPQVGEIRIPLGRDSKERLRVVPKGLGKESLTLYRVLEYANNADMSLVEAEIKTGRTHQIRVHFSAIGHPVVGDEKYARNKQGLERQFLHAYSLEFTDPFTNEPVKITSSLPEDLQNFLQKSGFSTYN